MSDTHKLMERISAFRTRLEEMPRILPLESSRSVAAAASIRDDRISEPSQLTGRAYRLLSEAKQLVDQQKAITSDSLMIASPESDPLARYHKGTISLTDSAIRLAQTFPTSAEAQLRLCDGFEHLLQVIRHRLGILEHALGTRRTDRSRIEHLANLLVRMHERKPVSSSDFLDLADVLIDDARQGQRLRFLSASLEADGLPYVVAAHAITVGHVLARLVPHDFEWAMKPSLPIVAALVMDVGMLDVPMEVLSKSEPLSVEERRLIERHPHQSAECVRTMMPDTGPLADLIAMHHERLDGSGYGQGLKAEEIPTLPRLLAVADVYAARQTDRPDRPALDSRSALTETLLEAEAGRLDRDYAEYLLNLSFHPLGTVVELTDGRLAVVAATHNSRTNLRASLRPVVAVLANARGEFLPRPEFVDLAASEVGSIVRSVPRSERQEKLGAWYPDLCV